MPMVMKAQNTAANTETICVREESDILGPFVFRRTIPVMQQT